MIFKKIISPSLSPNSSWKDVWISSSYILFPWKWKKLKNGIYIKKFEDEIQHFLPIKHAITFDSGRSALYAILKAMNIGTGDEVILQAFTCIVVPNSIIWCGAKPIYCDIDKKTFNINPALIEQKITKNTKALIIQHTFGKSAPTEELIKIGKKHNLKVIEDCAHALGTKYKNQHAGTFGDAALFSLGRDKVISSVHGGFAVTNDDILAKKLQDIKNDVPFPSSTKIYQHLIHPLAFAFILPLYNIVHIGKILLLVLQKLRFISKVFVEGEKKGKKPHDFPNKFPNALAELAYFQFTKLHYFNAQRKNIAERYISSLKKSTSYEIPVTNETEEHIFFRFPLLTSEKNKIIHQGKKQNILFGDWYDTAIAPRDADYTAVFYKPGSCPVAEAVAKKIINLPTHPRMKKKDVEEVITLLKKLK